VRTFSSFLFVAATLLLCVLPVHADETTRRAQEELRKRDLFYGEIDGRHTPAFETALRTYQERKGFVQTGKLDADTLRSLGVSETETGAQLPNVPVLRSDQAVGEGRERGAGGGSSAEQGTVIDGAPPSPQEIRTFLRNFLDACQTESLTDDLNFYGGRVEYFSHGTVTKGYIRNQLVAYDEEWPDRQYTIASPVTLGKRGFQIVASCRINFKLSNPEQKRHAAATTENTFVLARSSEFGLEIVGLKEQRVHHATTTRGAHRRSRHQNEFGRTMKRVGRTMRKIFR
jgi:peptidoglycan hydrolase-like protein with peptidoglycan-binding domain